MKPIVYFSITVLLWGLNFHLAKIILNEVRFIEAGFWRYLFGVIPLFLLAFKNRPSWAVIQENLKGVILVGVVCLFGFNFFFFLGMKHSPAINGALIVSTTPMLTILFSNQLLKTPLKRKHFLGVAISLLGVLYLILKGKLSNLLQVEFSLSDIFILIGSAFFALQNVWVKKYGGGMSNKNFTYLTNLFCFLSFAILLPFCGTETISTYSSAFWLSSIGIGLLGTAVAYFLWNEGIKLTSANQAGIFINAIPLTTALFSVLLGEELHSYHLISGILVIIGVLIIRR